ncbi:MAG: TonB-dependent receptor [Pseudomonadota bacterium]
MRNAGKNLATAWKSRRAAFSKPMETANSQRHPSLRRIFLFFCYIAATGLVSSNTAKAAPAEDDDLTQFSLEQLINLNVYSASKFTQKASDAPSAVTVITAADIKAYGYRKLVDILKSIRGIYGRYDRNYDFIGLRGFGRPGDYNSRFLLLLDGYRLNDAVYDTATVGTEFILDVDLIDRVEFVPGPGSSIYGSNAFFGVVNVITRTAKDVKDVKGLEASLETASYNTNKARLTYGKELDNGLHVLLSNSFYYSKGRNLYFKEFDTASTNNGIAQNLDYDRYGNFFTKLSYNAFTLMAAYSERKKGVPTSAYGTPFNDPNTHTIDKQTFIDLQYNQGHDEKLNMMARVFYGEFPYDGSLPYTDNNTVIINHDLARPQWWGGELKFVNTQFNKHKLVYGAEYRDNIRQDLSNYDDDSTTGYSESHSSRRYGIYIQDEYALRENWIINAGMRYDSYGGASNIINPRLGLIYKLDTSSTVKLLYGTAFRTPNAYELYYQTDLDKPNPTLKPEKIKTYDLIFEKYYDNRFRFVIDAFYYKTRDLIDQRNDPLDGKSTFLNIAPVEARGAEFEAERHWGNGAKIRASLALQKTRDSATGAALSNSPELLVKFNGLTPLFSTKLQSGFEVQYTGRRDTTNAGTAGGYVIANLTLLAGQWTKNLEMSMSVYNMFDKRYADPGGDEVSNTIAGTPSGLDTIYQDGRNYRFKLTYHF